jgi:hypothetical protein
MMQLFIDFIRNHPIYVVDAIVIIYVVILIRKKTQKERQERIAILHDSLATKTETKSGKNFAESHIVPRHTEPGT